MPNEAQASHKLHTLQSAPSLSLAFIIIKKINTNKSSELTKQDKQVILAVAVCGKYLQEILKARLQNNHWAGSRTHDLLSHPFLGLMISRDIRENMCNSIFLLSCDIMSFTRQQSGKRCFWKSTSDFRPAVNKNRWRIKGWEWRGCVAEIIHHYIFCWQETRYISGAEIRPRWILVRWREGKKQRLRKCRSSG